MDVSCFSKANLQICTRHGLYITASILYYGMEEQQQYESLYYEELLRCVYCVYSSLESSCVADYKNAFIKYISDRTSGVVEDMFNRHCRGLCSCGFDVYVTRGPNCWIDGVKYVSYGQYLSDVGHISYYVRVHDSVVGEVVELSLE